MNRLQRYPKELLEIVEATGREEADAKLAYGWITEVSFEQDKLKSVTAAESAGLSLRLVNQGRLGVAATNKLKNPSLGEVVTEAVEVAEFGPKAEFDFPLPGKSKRELKTWDPEIEKVKEEELVEKGNEMISLIKKELPGMRVNYLGFSSSSSGEYFINTNGVEAEERGTENSFGVEISRMVEGDFFQVWKGKSSVRADIDYTQLANEVVKLAKDGEKIVKPITGQARVVFTPDVFKDLLEYIVTAANGKLINEGVSKFLGKSGTEMFDKRFTTYEDPLIDWGLASTVIDDEGVLTVRKDLVKDGVIAGFYYDLMQAAKAGVKPTGNGFRSAYTQAGPGVTNIIVQEGDKKLTELLTEEKETLVVHQVLGAGQNNPYNGDFQLGVNLGYVWRNGEVAGRVKDTAVAGNIFDLLKSKLIWLSKDSEWVESFKVPYACLDDVVVTSK